MHCNLYNALSLSFTFFLRIVAFPLSSGFRPIFVSELKDCAVCKSSNHQSHRLRSLIASLILTKGSGALHLTNA